MADDWTLMGDGKVYIADAISFMVSEDRWARFHSLFCEEIMRVEAMAKFGESLRGVLMGRDHPDYDEARKVYNGMIDKRPLMIARCADVADVIAAVNFGRDNNILTAI